MFSFYFFVEESGRIETSRAMSTAIVKVRNNLLNKYYKPSEIIPSMGCFQEPESVSMQMQEDMHFLISFAMAIGMAPVPERIFYAHCCVSLQFFPMGMGVTGENLYSKFSQTCI